jgi:type IV pilus assembly protein PilA
VKAQGIDTNATEGQTGFSLVELLVVMLILGLLAAIAIPLYLNQVDKAEDADAKATTRAAQTAIEVYATQHDGRFTGADESALHDIEVSIPGDAPLALSNISENTYTVTVTSRTATDFSISRAASGAVSYLCSVEAAGGCPDDGDWG